MKDHYFLLGAFRAIDKAIEQGEMAIDVKNATVTMTTSLFSQLGRDVYGKPTAERFGNVVQNIRSYINFQRGFRIGRDGEAIPPEGIEALVQEHLLQRSDTLRGYIVTSDENHSLVMVFSHANGKLEGPEAVES